MTTHYKLQVIVAGCGIVRLKRSQRVRVTNTSFFLIVGVISCISNMENMTIFDLCGCQNVTGSFINSKEILRRNKRAVKPLEMFLGGKCID